MTIEQFNATGWTNGMTATWREDGEIYRIYSVDFGESLVGLVKVDAENPTAEDIQWARCESITLILKPLNAEASNGTPKT